jgi:hypothetical protein
MKYMLRHNILFLLSSCKNTVILHTSALSRTRVFLCVCVRACMRMCLCVCVFVPVFSPSNITSTSLTTVSSPYPLFKMYLNESITSLAVVHIISRNRNSLFWQKLPLQQPGVSTTKETTQKPLLPKIHKSDYRNTSTNDRKTLWWQSTKSIKQSVVSTLCRGFEKLQSVTSPCQIAVTFAQL